MKYTNLSLFVVANLFSGSNAECRISKTESSLPDFVTTVEGPAGAENNVAMRRKLAQINAAPRRELQSNMNARVKIEGNLTEADVRSFFTLWDDFLGTGDSRMVASRYGEGAVLLPTMSDTPRTDFEGIKDYFDSFLAKDPRGEILDGHIRIGEDWATDVGIYQFTMGKTGEQVRGRYSYFYEPDEKGLWKISHHHSSMMPEEMGTGKAITEAEVKDLFNLWNDALKTGDPSEVALRYSENAVLLPTMSDSTRPDFCRIEDYFIHFLKNEPVGEILESHVMIGVNWAQDVGVYEFTMGTTGKKVKGRYSFVYVYENGAWKISHHHSSVMPESIITAEPITHEEVRGLFDVWNAALQTEDPYKVAALYSDNGGNLLPTLSDRHRESFLDIADYFVHFLKYKPEGKIISGATLVGTNWAQDAGIYEFTMGTTGDVVRGRYTFVYVFENGKWKISQHHSSMMPEATKTEAITEQEVKNLFELWNAALMLQDPDAVTKRYAKEAVLLPTMSDTPRTNYDLIKDYFVKFTADAPSGEILESFVTIGDNWCSDVGIYEFTMRNTGQQVKGRYSFVYVFEDGQWKISHHHSSQMPEEINASSVEEAIGGGGSVKSFVETAQADSPGSELPLFVGAACLVVAGLVGAVIITKKRSNN